MMIKQTLNHRLYVFINDEMVENTVINKDDFNRHDLVHETIDKYMEKYPNQKVNVRLDTEMIVRQSTEMYYQ